jgi:pimeloyl-ACP methyl ester carboxylesterase
VKPPLDASALFKPAEALTEPQVLIESSRVPAPVMRVEWWPQALADRAETEGRAFLRFDYLGHGESSGAFRDGTISRWRADAIAAIG